MPPKFAIPVRTSSLIPSDQIPPSTDPPLVVPERHSSLMSPGHQNAILHRTTISYSRRVSAASTISATSSISQFVDQKAKVLEADLELLKAYRDGLSDLKTTKKIDIGEYDKTFREVENRKRQLDKENLVLKRQRKILEEDIDDEISANIGASHGELDKIMEIAYSSLVTDKVMAASNLSTQGPKHNQSKYRQAVIKYLSAKPHEGLVWCHILGRHIPSRLTIAAHIVPKSLESEQLSYLFGASDLRVSMDRRNGLTLAAQLEKSLDAGQLVIVPMRPQPQDGATRWKCIVIDQEIMEKPIITLGLGDTVLFKDVHNKPLEFLSNNRPAKRYLYFRFIVTYLYHKRRASNLEWVAQVEAKGTLWATPGPYLRKSMLIALARRASDHYAPEAFWNGVFEEVNESPSRSATEEETLSYALSVQIDAKMDSAHEENMKEGSDEEEDMEEDAEYDPEE
ncbi:hypothetical protein C8Q69DRAFT_460581 [Paecilomyces variotii]|uniref:HNH nuclease domain-containing protein n=1 Tax=Byssochlamys spectabilis TaxID=264951 RepID=A0A443HXR8_BYSSP|nr:hypothetical protein C8Q69DRAFT_460581 [Paecilomyces variotii]KAJ9208722.1 hypothetical protein DTO032I3_699 [Paecilomyces variotii]KAJ9223616.1 hypothetical protein DTO169C6_3968 [Paecilomyces variotii]KAJ9252878.1 hypothetical protein DTO195F2_7299 [Paecilomyces variotii]KAJ9282565.1 hypothetical protein DTO021D3_713 [Paecilomyces variotii]KAJ9344291.1 hypothetical protein DTO027B6_3328 [Paecilomyces variotii]